MSAISKSAVKNLMIFGPINLLNSPTLLIEVAFFLQNQESGHVFIYLRVSILQRWFNWILELFLTVWYSLGFSFYLQSKGNKSFVSK